MARSDWKSKMRIRIYTVLLLAIAAVVLFLQAVYADVIVNPTPEASKPPDEPESNLFLTVTSIVTAVIVAASCVVLIGIKKKKVVAANHKDSGAPAG